MGDSAIPMILTCPSCGGRHIDEGEFATKLHHTHACQHCGTVWRPAIEPTVGVQFLPGFKNERPPPSPVHCRHEAYAGACVHCGVPLRFGQVDYGEPQP